MTEDNKVLNESISSDAPRRITILGSTGSIGSSTIDLIERNLSSYRVEALTAYRNVDLLAEQARKLDAQFVAIGDSDKYADLKKAISGSNTEVAAGPEATADAPAAATAKPLAPLGVAVAAVACCRTSSCASSPVTFCWSCAFACCSLASSCCHHSTAGWLLLLLLPPLLRDTK